MTLNIKKVIAVIVIQGLLLTGMPAQVTCASQITSSCLKQLTITDHDAPVVTSALRIARGAEAAYVFLQRSGIFSKQKGLSERLERRVRRYLTDPILQGAQLSIQGDILRIESPVENVVFLVGPGLVGQHVIRLNAELGLKALYRGDGLARIAKDPDDPQVGTVEFFLRSKLNELGKNPGVHLVVLPEDIKGWSGRKLLDEDTLNILYRIIEYHHAGQTRIAGENTPYLVHLLGVVAIMLDLGARDPDVLAAGFLHDIFEKSNEFYRGEWGKQKDKITGREERKAIRDGIELDVRTELQGTELNIERVILLMELMTVIRDYTLPYGRYADLIEQGSEAVALPIADKTYNVLDLPRSDKDWLAKYIYQGSGPRKPGIIPFFMNTPIRDDRPLIDHLASNDQRTKFKLALLRAILNNNERNGVFGNEGDRQFITNVLHDIDPDAFLQDERSIGHSLLQIQSDLEGSLTESAVPGWLQGDGIVRGPMEDRVLIQVLDTRLKTVASRLPWLNEYDINWDDPQLRFSVHLGQHVEPVDGSLGSSNPASRSYLFNRVESVRQALEGIGIKLISIPLDVPQVPPPGSEDLLDDIKQVRRALFAHPKVVFITATQPHKKTLAGWTMGEENTSMETANGLLLVRGEDGQVIRSLASNSTLSSFVMQYKEHWGRQGSVPGTLKDKKAAILGGWGGVGQGLTMTLIDEGVDSVVVSELAQHVETVRRSVQDLLSDASLDDGRIRVYPDSELLDASKDHPELLEALRNVDIIINATGVGMDEIHSPVRDPSVFKREGGKRLDVIDMIYRGADGTPITVTPFLRQAWEQGVRNVHNGTRVLPGVFVIHAEWMLKEWTGQRVDLSEPYNDLYSYLVTERGLKEAYDVLVADGLTEERIENGVFMGVKAAGDSTDGIVAIGDGNEKPDQPTGLSELSSPELADMAIDRSKDKRFSAVRELATRGHPAQPYLSHLLEFAVGVVPDRDLALVVMGILRQADPQQLFPDTLDALEVAVSGSVVEVREAATQMLIDVGLRGQVYLVRALDAAEKSKQPVITEIVLDALDRVPYLHVDMVEALEDIATNPLQGARYAAVEALVSKFLQEEPQEVLIDLSVTVRWFEERAGQDRIEKALVQILEHAVVSEGEVENANVAEIIVETFETIVSSEGPDFLLPETVQALIAATEGSVSEEITNLADLVALVEPFPGVDAKILQPFARQNWVKDVVSVLASQRRFLDPEDSSGAQAFLYRLSNAGSTNKVFGLLMSQLFDPARAGANFDLDLFQALSEINQLIQEVLPQLSGHLEEHLREVSEHISQMLRQESEAKGSSRSVNLEPWRDHYEANKALVRFFAGVRKADLHHHLDGAVSADLVLKFMALYPQIRSRFVANVFGQAGEADGELVRFLGLPEHETSWESLHEIVQPLLGRGRPDQEQFVHALGGPDAYWGAIQKIKEHLEYRPGEAEAGTRNILEFLNKFDLTNLVLYASREGLRIAARETTLESFREDNVRLVEQKIHNLTFPFEMDLETIMRQVMAGLQEARDVSGGALWAGLIVSIFKNPDLVFLEAGRDYQEVLDIARTDTRPLEEVLSHIHREVEVALESDYQHDPRLHARNRDREVRELEDAVKELRRRVKRRRSQGIRWPDELDEVDDEVRRELLIFWQQRQAATEQVRRILDAKQKIANTDPDLIEHLVGIDTVGSEVGSEAHRELDHLSWTLSYALRLAGANGLAVSDHAGESFPEGDIFQAHHRIKAAIETGVVQRIGHATVLGIHPDELREAVWTERPGLPQRVYTEAEIRALLELREEIYELIEQSGVVIETNPTSNVLLLPKYIRTYSRHPVRHFWKRIGRQLVVSSDDPSILHTMHLRGEWAKVWLSHPKFTFGEILQIIKNGFDHATVSDRFSYRGDNIGDGVREDLPGVFKKLALYAGDAEWEYDRSEVRGMFVETGYIIGEIFEELMRPFGIRVEVSSGFPEEIHVVFYPLDTELERQFRLVDDGAQLRKIEIPPGSLGVVKFSLIDVDKKPGLYMDVTQPSYSFRKMKKVNESLWKKFEFWQSFIPPLMYEVAQRLEFKDIYAKSYQLSKLQNLEMDQGSGRRYYRVPYREFFNLRDVSFRNLFKSWEEVRESHKLEQGHEGRVLYHFGGDVKLWHLSLSSVAGQAAIQSPSWMNVLQSGPPMGSKAGDGLVVPSERLGPWTPYQPSSRQFRPNNSVGTEVMTEFWVRQDGKNQELGFEVEDDDGTQVVIAQVGDGLQIELKQLYSSQTSLGREAGEAFRPVGIAYHASDFSFPVSDGLLHIRLLDKGDEITTLLGPGMVQVAFEDWSTDGSQTVDLKALQRAVKSLGDGLGVDALIQSASVMSWMPVVGSSVRVVTTRMLNSLDHIKKFVSRMKNEQRRKILEAVLLDLAA